MVSALRLGLEAGVIFLLACDTRLPAPDPGQPDIVLISIDTLRADHLGSYGNPRQPSPFLDRLAGGGLRFTRARAASPWTLPSHTTMLSGLWPTDHGVVEDTVKVPDSLPWIPQALREQGFATGAVVSTVYVSRAYDFQRGFDHFEDFGITLKNNLGRPVRAEQVVDDALRWASSVEAGKPIFLFIHLYDVHYPYLPPDPYNTRYDRAGTTQSTAYRTYAHYLEHPVPSARMEHLKAQYDETIAYVDHELERLHTRWSRPATWIVTADHGEELGERGSWGHGHTLRPEVMEIPLVVAGPGVSSAVRDERAGTIDIAASIAALAGRRWEGPGVDLRSPVPVRPILAETSRFKTAMISLLTDERRFELDLRRGHRALYDLTTDPDERAPLREDPAAVEQALFRLMPERYTADGPVETDGWAYHDGALVEQPTGRFGVYPADATVSGATSDRVLPQAGLDAATRAQLEALGYQQ